MIERSHTTRVRDLAFLTGAALLLLLFGLGGRELWLPDEPRHAAIAEELRSFVHGWRGLVLLHLNGAVYTQKPPLYYWLAALAGAPAGRVTELGARLPSAFAALGTLALVAQLGRRMFRPTVGWLAVAVLLTLPAFLGAGRLARPDALLTLCVTAAFVLAWRLDRGEGSERANRLLLHAAMGMGVLAKGPVALLLPLLAVLAYLLWQRRLGQIRRFVTLPALALSLGPGLVWFAAAAALGPSDFVANSFWDNLVLRYFAGSAHAEPWWYYAKVLPKAFLPWTLAWPLCALRARAAFRDPAASEARRAFCFLIAAIGAALVFFSVSTGKRVVYLQPIYPLAAVLCAAALADAYGALSDPRRRERWLRAARIALPVVVAGEVAFYGWLEPTLDSRNSLRQVAEAAAAAAGPEGPIGVFDDDSKAASIAYYARREVRPLAGAEDAARFVAGGGRGIVIEQRHLARLGDLASYRVVGRIAARGREFLVLAPALRTPVGAEPRP